MLFSALLTQAPLSHIFLILGDSVRLVGGCVRDALLNRPPGDLDMACMYPPEITTQKLEEAGIRVIPTGFAHGTVTALINGVSVEITTLRKDRICDGRHAEIVFTDDWQQDAARRDFTLNALYLDRHGTLYDYLGGVEDALAGRVRFVGDAQQRIAEDALRILRFFRFFAWFGQGEMDKSAKEACLAHGQLLTSLSGERIAQEMWRLLAAPSPASTLWVMQTILPEIALSAPENAVNALERLDSLDVRLRLACLLSPEALPPLTMRWKLAGLDVNYLRKLVESQYHALADWSLAQQKKAIRFYGKDVFSDMICLAKAHHPYNATILGAMQQWACEWEIPMFSLTGEDLLKLGIPQGKRIGEILAQLETEWEEGDYQWKKAELLERVKR